MSSIFWFSLSKGANLCKTFLPDSPGKEPRKAYSSNEGLFTMFSFFFGTLMRSEMFFLMELTLGLVETLVLFDDAFLLPDDWECECEVLRWFLLLLRFFEFDVRFLLPALIMGCCKVLLISRLSRWVKLGSFSYIYFDFNYAWLFFNVTCSYGFVSVLISIGSFGILTKLSKGVKVFELRRVVFMFDFCVLEEERLRGALPEGSFVLLVKF